MGNWSSLTLEAFPALDHVTTFRSIFSRGGDSRTNITFVSDPAHARLLIEASRTGERRAWVLRLHLLPFQRVVEAVQHAQVLSFHHIFPNSSKYFFPFRVKGSQPAAYAGPVAEIELGSSAEDLEVSI